MITCSNCGKQVAESQVHCGHCGQRVVSGAGPARTMIGIAPVNSMDMQKAIAEAKAKALGQTAPHAESAPVPVVAAEPAPAAPLVSEPAAPVVDAPAFARTEAFVQPSFDRMQQAAQSWGDDFGSAPTAAVEQPDFSSFAFTPDSKATLETPEEGGFAPMEALDASGARIAMMEPRAVPAAQPFAGFDASTPSVMIEPMAFQAPAPQPAPSFTVPPQAQPEPFHVTSPRPARSHAPDVDARASARFQSPAYGGDLDGAEAGGTNKKLVVMLAVGVVALIVLAGVAVLLM